MKNTLLLIFILSNFYLNVNAQRERYIKSGVNLLTIRSTSLDNVQSNYGFHIGAGCNYNIGKNFSITPEILFTRESYNYEWYSMDKYRDVEIKSNNYNIPIFSKVTFRPEKDFKIYIEAAPFAGISFIKKHTITTLSNFVDPEEEHIPTNDNDQFMDLNFGVIVGTGVNINNVLIAFSYDLGLAKYDTGDDQEYKSSLLMISIGYLFR